MTMRNVSQNVISNSNVNNTISYTGRRYDKESELYYYRNRMYSPTLARFMQRDPKGYVDGMNLYAYVKNNPLKYLDAFGTTANIANSIFNGWDVPSSDNFYLNDPNTQSYFTDDYGNATVDYSRNSSTDDYSVTYNDSGFGNSESINYAYNSSEVRVQENDNFYGVINDTSYEFIIKDSNLPQSERDPSRLTAQNAYRSLGGAPEIIAPLIEWFFPLYGLFNDDTNTKFEHQHTWWSDNSNIGFHKTEEGVSEIFKEKVYMRDEYYNWSNTIYEGDAMKASKNVTNAGIYDLIDLTPIKSCNSQNNYQDYTDRLIDNYNKMVNIHE